MIHIDKLNASLERLSTRLKIAVAEGHDLKQDVGELREDVVQLRGLARETTEMLDLVTELHRRVFLAYPSK